MFSVAVVITMRYFLPLNLVLLLMFMMGFDHPPVNADPAPTGLNQSSVKTNEHEKKVMFHGTPQAKRIAITFDDGPDDHYTLQILDILKKHHVPATFFVVGQWVKRNPTVLQRIVREGHTVGNHSWDHADFTKLKKSEIKQQLKKTNQLIEKKIGKQPTFFRPPFGAMNARMIDHVFQEGYSIVYWNIDTLDWKGRSAKKIMKTIQGEQKEGSIILFHSAGGPHSLDGTVKALPKLIVYLRKQGYELVTIDQLLEQPAYSS